MSKIASERRELIREALGQIEGHLCQESSHLDRVIEFSRNLQRQLHLPPNGSPDQLPPLFDALQQEQVAIDHSRSALLRALQGLPGQPANLSGVLAQCGADEGRKLRSLRQEIHGKLQTLRGITLGSQMVLYYTVDFYQRLLKGLVGAEGASKGYSPHGRTETVDTGRVVERDC